MNRILAILTTYTLLIAYTGVNAQNTDPRGFEPDRLFWGGNLGAGFGTITNVDVSPTLGYMFFDRFGAGLGFTYQYYADKRYVPAVTLSITGARVFARLYPLEQLFLHGEYEFLSYTTNMYTGIDKERINVSGLLGGGGYRYQVGGNSWAYLMILYNFNETIYTPYSNPVFRVGVDIGF
jgi:hypothetical protein